MHDRTIVAQLMHIFERGAINEDTGEPYFDEDENLLGDKGFYTKFDEERTQASLRAKREQVREQVPPSTRYPRPSYFICSINWKITQADTLQTSIIGMLRGVKGVNKSQMGVHDAEDIGLEEGLLCPARLAVEQAFGLCGNLFPIFCTMKKTGHDLESIRDIINAVFVLYMMWCRHKGNGISFVD